MMVRLTSSCFIRSSARTFLSFSDYLLAWLDHLAFWDVRVVSSSRELDCRIEDYGVRTFMGS